MPQAAPIRGGIALATAFVVEDELHVLKYVTNILTAAGYRTHQFASGSEVEAALLELSPNVIVLDLSLRNSDAVDVIRNLAARHYPGDILLMSGHDEATLTGVHQIGTLRGLSMLEPLHKPFKPSQLRRRLSLVGRETRAQTGISLEAAIQNNWLELWYQPKIDLKTMLASGAEALVRMRHPEHGLIDAGQFLPPPGHELYQPLTTFILRTAMADWLRFAARKITGRLSLNVPPTVLQRPDFVDSLRRYLPTHPSFPGLTVEITEADVIEDLDLAREIAVQLKLYNVHMAIDGFGSMPSSLESLRELPFAEIKLTPSLVAGCATDPQKRRLCQAISTLAERVGVTTVAVGVETEAQLGVLFELGYDVAQGNLFAPPMPAPAFAEMIIERSGRH